MGKWNVEVGWKRKTEVWLGLTDVRGLGYLALGRIGVD